MLDTLSNSINTIRVKPEAGVRREFDATAINIILNDPSVFPHVAQAGMEALDVSPILADPGNVLLMAEGGGILFCHDDPGIYEVHTNFLPKFRGRNAIRASLAAYRWMFTHTDCMQLQTRIPSFNKGAALVAKIVGATPWFTRAKAWQTESGPDDLTYYALHYHEWVRRTDELIESGHVFHTNLDQEYERHGKPPHVHADEDCHDRHVGVCVETIYGGQPEKAVVLYNRWARFAGYEQIAMVSRSPIIINIGEALLLVTDQDFKVIKCR